MSDSVTIGFKSQRELSPAVYLHWDGDRWQELLKKAAPTLRDCDSAYSTARFCAVCCEENPGNLSVGIVIESAPDVVVDFDARKIIIQGDEEEESIDFDDFFEKGSLKE